MNVPSRKENAGCDDLRAGFASYLRSRLGPGGRFEVLRGRGGPGDEHELVEERRAFERDLGAEGWTGVGWPGEHGGRGADLRTQVALAEEYARAGGPGRLGHVGETLVGPTIIAFGTPDQQRRFLPPILAGDELWCQGYSEPDAGSDLANVRTRAELDGDEWVVNGQKVWTSLAAWSDWSLVLARTEEGSSRHRGLSYLLVPMRQHGVEVRLIVQLTGGSEFNEVFFTGARTHRANAVGEPGEGWKVAMGTLGFERGASTLAQVLRFEAELGSIVGIARRRGLAADPLVRQRLAAAHSRLRIMRWNAERMLAADGAAGGPAMITKLFWSHLHRDLGELAMDVAGLEGIARVAGGGETALARLFLFSRADTIYAGTSEIQRNLIGERTLKLPKEPS